ncbi:AraC family transcriptional regulator [Mesorhizobium sp. YR577]|jgi:AraC-like DNA-binding protein|uniref:helix-turn-helix domain-containing protein n=1 Tax=Mesorhizobium sp. YR577 TaxID=1884373 RepID=UPI0008DEC1B5|nr:AraC family transcriptional regulator [Mesorhizobium sp. YR577]SFT93253.1 AraC-type DNA-binding protein [Mesorhizobium sp. YR577]
MKPFLERLRPEPGTSWAMLNRRLDDGIPFQWHHHPELELTLTCNSRGQRFIGDHIGSYDDGDLVLIGPNLPHTWHSTEKIEDSAPHVALVMWFLPDWASTLSATLVEFSAIASMVERAANGLKFTQSYAARARPLIEDLFSRPADERLLSLMRVLNMLAQDAGAEPLASARSVPARAGVDRSRLDRVLDHIHLNYASGLSLGELAEVAALSPSGLHRLFRRHAHVSISDYIMRLKVGEACAMLSGTERPVAHIADAVGYETLANFNRQFKALKGLTPREYRKSFQDTR